MAHFAKLDENNVVVHVVAGSDKNDGREDYLSEKTGDVYKQTSYNTFQGVHYDPVTRKPSADQSKAFRGNYAGIGFTYDADLDAFIPPKPGDNYILDESTYSWIEVNNVED